MPRNFGKTTPLAARLYSVMALEILAQGKSRSYPRALWHLKEVRELRSRADCADQWQELLDRVRQTHRRKYGFMADLENMVKNVCKPPPETLNDRARKQLVQKRDRGISRGRS